VETTIHLAHLLLLLHLLPFQLLFPAAAAGSCASFLIGCQAPLLSVPLTKATLGRFHLVYVTLDDVLGLNGFPFLHLLHHLVKNLVVFVFGTGGNLVLVGVHVCGHIRVTIGTADFASRQFFHVHVLILGLFLNKTLIHALVHALIQALV